MHIPKGDGRTRPLGVPALEDKLVQQAARMVLEPIYEAMFVGFSYGFRPGRSAHDALDALATAIGRKVNWVLDADIQSFFDTIDHGWMQQFLEHRIGDSRMVRLVMKWVRAGVMEDGKLSDVGGGDAAKGVISPLLANIYLHYAFDLWVQKWRKTEAHGEVYVVRYADDVVMGFEVDEDARRCGRLWPNALSGSASRFTRTRPGAGVRRYARERRERRGLPKPETFDFLGFTHIAGTSRRGTFQLQRRTSAAGGGPSSPASNRRSTDDDTPRGRAAPLVVFGAARPLPVLRRSHELPSVEQLLARARLDLASQPQLRSQRDGGRTCTGALRAPVPAAGAPDPSSLADRTLRLPHDPRGGEPGAETARRVLSGGGPMSRPAGTAGLAPPSSP